MVVPCRRTALQCAAYGGFTECLSVLITEGRAEVNIQDAEGITALHWACSVGSVDAVQLLVGMGANLNVMEVDGEKLTPLDYAVIGSHQEVAQLLIERGALSISSIRELAATMIQRCMRGYLTRKKVGPELAEHRLKLAALARTDLPISSTSSGSRRSLDRKSRVMEEVGDGGGGEGGRREVEDGGRRADRDDKTAERMRSVSLLINVYLLIGITSTHR